MDNHYRQKEKRETKLDDFNCYVSLLSELFSFVAVKDSKDANATL